MTKEKLRKRIIETCVKSLKDFGWPAVTEKNITSDEVYSYAFKNLLESMLPELPKGWVKTEIEELIKELKK